MKSGAASISGCSVTPAKNQTLGGAERAVAAAALHAGISFKITSHSSKAQAAKELACKHGLPDVSSLLAELNDARKSTSYCDAPWPNLNAEDVATEAERFLSAVEASVGL
jgi:hypothetical protein